VEDSPVGSGKTNFLAIDIEEPEGDRSGASFSKGKILRTAGVRVKTTRSGSFCGVNKIPEMGTISTLVT
jgi:hypothetical protein